MKKCPHTGDAVYDEFALEASLTKAVEHFVGLGCRIFNLSLGNSNAPYDGAHVRGLAYILEVLSRRHNILFVVSTGNFRGSEEPPVPANGWRDDYPEYLIAVQSAIIDPAPAMTVFPATTPHWTARGIRRSISYLRPPKISHRHLRGMAPRLRGLLSLNSLRQVATSLAP